MAAVAKASNEPDLGDFDDSSAGAEPIDGLLEWWARYPEADAVTLTLGCDNEEVGAAAVGVEAVSLSVPLSGEAAAAVACGMTKLEEVEKRNLVRSLWDSLSLVKLLGAVVLSAEIDSGIEVERDG